MAKDYGGPPKPEPTSQRLTLIIGISGLCILCYVVGAWHGRSAAATANLAASQSGISTAWSDDDDNNNNKNDVAAAAFTEKETKSGSQDVVPGTMSDPLVSDNSQPQQPGTMSDPLVSDSSQPQQPGTMSDPLVSDSSQPQQPQVVSNADNSGGSFPPCNMSLSEYTPCEDRDRGRRFNRTMLQYRERHCPSKEEMLQCLIPAPPNYTRPFKWPESRDFAWYANIPHKELSIEKAVQNWIQVEGDRFKFPGGGTMFPHGADAYIDDINALIPLTDGSIRTAVDTGCGVASWGAYLLKRNIITMSFAPRDTHEAQVWFALERGVPAMLGVLGSKRLPYPSRAFDMAHCSRCLVPWFAYDGLYLTEVDRILRPGGYWILSGPPIRWRTYWQGWNRTAEDLSQEQDKIEEVAKKLCWSKVIEKEDLSIWQKPVNHNECAKLKNTYPQPPMCAKGNEDLAWYKNLEPCITPLPEASNPNEVAGGTLMNWPDRALAAPPRIRNGLVKGFTAQKFQEDNNLWKSRVTFYKNLVKELPQGLFRNVMDMNAGLGGFAAALIKFPVWVMNVVPADASPDTLGVIYERGFIGTYMDWCEGFSTYPRTYDLIHANGVISIYQDKCNVTDILLEMDRILRPQGKVIFRDNIDVLNRVKLITDKLRWEGQIYDNESGPSNPEKLLICRKSYWTAEQKQGRK